MQYSKLYNIFFYKVRFRSTSFLASFAYLYVFDYYLQFYFLHAHKNDRIVKVNNAFDYHLVKKKSNNNI